MYSRPAAVQTAARKLRVRAVVAATLCFAALRGVLAGHPLQSASSSCSSTGLRTVPTSRPPKVLPADTRSHPNFRHHRCRIHLPTAPGAHRWTYP